MNLAMGLKVYRQQLQLPFMHL